MVERMGESVGYNRSSNIGSVVGYSSPTIQAGTYKPPQTKALSIDGHYRAEHAWFWGAVGAILGGVLFWSGIGVLAGAAVGALAGGSYESAHARSSYNLSSKQIESLQRRSPKAAAMYTKAVAYAKSAVVAGCKTADDVAAYVRASFAKHGVDVDGALEGIVVELQQDGSEESESAETIRATAHYRSNANADDAEEPEQTDETPDAEEAPEDESGD